MKSQPKTAPSSRWIWTSKTTPSPSVDTSDSSKNYIGIENAKQTALSKAGLSSSSVHWEKAELDYDDGRAEYELKFHSGHREYECAVDAISGKVLSFERD